MDSLDVLHFLLSAYDEGMINGEYVFIVLDVNLGKFEYCQFKGLG